MLNEFYRVAFRKKIYRTIEEVQADLDVWIEDYNQQHPIKAADVMARHRYRRSGTVCRWRRRKY
jgi:hypothetical protein